MHTRFLALETVSNPVPHFLPVPIYLLFDLLFIILSRSAASLSGGLGQLFQDGIPQPFRIPLPRPPRPLQPETHFMGLFKTRISRSLCPYPSDL